MIRVNLPMYYPASDQMHFLDAQRILEIHRMHYLMEKHHHLQTCDPYESIKKLAMVEQVSRKPDKPLTSFKIKDILEKDAPEINNKKQLYNNCTSDIRDSHRKRHDLNDSLEDSDFSESSAESSVVNRYSSRHSDINAPPCNKIIRPWSTSPVLDMCLKGRIRSKSGDTASSSVDYSTNSKRLRKDSRDISDEEEIDVEKCDEDESQTGSKTGRRQNNPDLSPLDALVAMSSKTFMGLDSLENQRNRENDKHKSQSPRKKRKTRTAFTNQQIYELERRFIMQKYLTPADRDEIAGRLGLTCAQVITWFQNRRAKFKRDIEEMKNDVVATNPEDDDKR